MKRNDSGDFCILYIEPEDDQAGLFNALAAISRQYGSKKPVILMLPAMGRARLFARPEDFGDLKHFKRQYGLLILFVVAGNEHLHYLATRSGFPAYASIDELNSALFQGQISFAHQRAMARPPSQPLQPVQPAPPVQPVRSSPSLPSSPLPPPLEQRELRTSVRKTVPLSPPAPAAQFRPPEPMILPAKPAPTPAPQSGVSTIRTPTSAPPSALPPAAAPTTRYSRPLTETPLPQVETPTHPQNKRGGHGLLVVLIILSLILLGAGGGLSYYFLYAHADSTPPAVAPQIVGSLYFLSSEQVSETSNQGLNDQVQIDLHNIQPPAPGNSYYAWLLSDASQGDSTVIPLGTLTVSHGSAHLFYSGDAQHTNLLAITSRFLVTEENTSPAPIEPTPNYNAWRFYGSIPQTPSPQDPDHYSLLDHLRHLLASDPLLNELELPGGLCNWFYRNSDKLIEWTVSARDNWQQGRDLGFEQRQVLRTLSYLDGLAFIQRDLPAGVTLPSVPNLASVGLVDVQGANQEPPSYMTHILRHLNGLINAPGSTTQQRQVAAQIIAAMSNVEQWFEQMRSDAKQFIAMSNAQLNQPAAFSLLNDMVDLANNAYTGQSNPATGTTLQGVIWIHAQIQALANMVVYTYLKPIQTPEFVPATQISAT